MKSFFCLICLFLTACSTYRTNPETDALLSGNFDDVSSVVQSNLAVAQVSGTSIYTYAGVFLFVFGSLVFAFFNRPSGLQLICAGALAGSIPFVVSSEYFNWIVGGSLFSVACFGLWHLWFKIKQAEDASDAKTDKKD